MFLAFAHRSVDRFESASHRRDTSYTVRGLNEPSARDVPNSLKNALSLFSSTRSYIFRNSRLFVAV